MGRKTSGSSDEGNRHVIIVDDEKDFVLSLVDILESRGYKTETAYSVEATLTKLRGFRAHLALIDIRLGRASGIDLMGRLQTEYPEILCVMMTAYAAVDSAIEALQEGAYDYLRKPFNPRDLLATLDRCFDRITLEKEKTFAVKALKESETKYRELVQDASSIILRMNIDGNITFINKFGQNFFGFTEEELLGKNVSGTIVPADETSVHNLAEIIQELERNPDQYTGRVNENMLRNGERVWISWSNKAIRDKHGNISGVLCVGNDTTARKRMGDLIHIQRDLGLALSAETNLEKGLELCFDAAIKVSGMDCGGIHLLDSEPGTFKLIFSKGINPEFINDIVSLNAGLNHSEPVAADFPVYSRLEDLDQPPYKTDTEEAIHAVAIVPLVHEGQIIGCLDLASRSRSDIPIFNRDALETIASQVSNVIIRLKTEDSLRDSEEKYRLLVENANDAIFIVQDDTIKFSNSKTFDITGYSPGELEKIPFYNLIHSQDRKLVTETHKRKLEGEDRPNTFSFRLINKNSEELWVQLSSISIRWEGRPAALNFMRDTSQLKRLEEQLQQAQKMEAIGTLAGGIAHDFNNILAAIMGYTEIAEIQIDDSSPARISLSKVLKSSERAKSLVNQILSFSRRSEEEKKPVQITPIVKEVFKLLRSSLPATIEIRQHINDENGVIEADPIKIHQILMNLCTNAHHAMRENGGILDFTLSSVSLGIDEAVIYPGLNPGPYLKLSISDTGTGMDEKTMAKIFEPYFTTKEKGEGTGLGLAVVHGIVKNYNGSIIVKSEPGKGTAFHLFLPRLETIEDVSEALTGKDLPTGNECVLYIDDEPDLVDVGQQMLEYLGYKVITRTSCVEALNLFRSCPEIIDLIITDTTMPYMTGLELSRILMGIRPDIPIILCTGFSERITEQTAKKAGVREFVIKPLVMKDLAVTVRKVLDSACGYTFSV